MTFGIEIILFFALLSLGASVVNGALGYGYSSISVPLALLVFVNRILNPAYVLLEAMLNTVMLGFAGKRSIAATFWRTLPVMVSVVPGVIVGSLVLNYVAPLWIRFLVYALVLPLILLQAAGFRRPLNNEAKAGVPLGMGVGMLYSITTISGPPIALFWNNQGLVKGEFKAALAQIRIAESYVTVITYYFLGLFSSTSLSLFTVIAPPLLLGIPLGMYLLRRVAIETFRRVCMSFDAWIVGYGLSRTIIPILNASDAFAYFVWSGVIAIDAALLYRFFKNRASKLESKVRER